ncbi:MAG TPA: hypothetical protein VFU43_21615 [Streptosporangiaceae bacterium]|nr:hypothetical protein [Streptosporangiaceae bacterium]
MRRPVFAFAAAVAPAALPAATAWAGPLAVGPVGQVSPANSPIPGADAGGQPRDGVTGDRSVPASDIHAGGAG